MERWGLGYEEVRRVNPAVIYLTMPMQGATGPHRDYLGFGSTIAAAAGLADPSGLPGRPLTGTGTHFPDHVPNPGHALVALLAAVYRRSRTGEGAVIELAQLELTVNIVGPSILAASLGSTAARRGNRSPEAVPHGVFPCDGDDSWCAISATTEEQWHALVRVLGAGDAGAGDAGAGDAGTGGLAGDPRFRDAAARGQHEAQLEETLASYTRKFDRWSLAAELQAAGVAAMAVETTGDLLTDPNLTARQFWRALEHPVLGTYSVGSMPFSWPGGSRGPSRAAPLLGAHTAEIASALLKMSASEIEAARADRLLV